MVAMGVGVIIAEHPPTAGQGLLEQGHCLAMLTSNRQIGGRLVQQPQPHHRLHVQAPAVVGNDKYMGQQPTAFRPVGGLVAFLGKAGPEQTNGGRRPNALGMVVQAGVNHGLQQSVREQPIGDDSHKREAAQGGHCVAQCKRIGGRRRQWLWQHIAMGR
jgi:hypothetical protein